MKVYDSSYLAAPQQGQSIQAWIFVIPVGCPNDMPCVEAVVALDQIVGTCWYKHSTTRRLNGRENAHVSDGPGICDVN